MNINYSEYLDRVRACFIGKNIGGTMGAPYEGVRSTLDIDGFATDPGVALPNDDLDLQLVWLHAMEKVGPYAFSADKLADFWTSFIPTFWAEYGIAKVNISRGLTPPLTGDYKNSWSKSNGAWIRTEVFATLAPCAPDIAAKYAIEDAMVDHGTDEGTIAAAFVAAMQSAAFGVRDIRRVIDIALSKIPSESRIAKSIRLVLECYDGGVPAMEARERVLASNSDIGDGWFEAPSNVAYAVIGLVYGEGDFKKSMITAINCGDDTDCTAATVGATLGILGGTESIPKDWSEHIGDRIVTVAIAASMLNNLPKTCTELTERIAALAPAVLIANGTGITVTDRPADICDDIEKKLLECDLTLKRLQSMKPYSFTNTDLGIVNVTVTYDGEPEICPMGEKKLSVRFDNTRFLYSNMPFNLELRWWVPDGFSVKGAPRCVRITHINTHDDGSYECQVTVNAGERVEPVNRVVLEVSSEGRHKCAYVPIVLLG